MTGKPFLSVLLRDHFKVLCSLRNTFLSQSALGLFTNSCWRLWRFSAPPLSHHLESREIFLRCDAFHLVLFSPDSTKLCIFLLKFFISPCVLLCSYASCITLCSCPRVLSQEFSCSPAKPATFLSQSCFPAFYTTMIPDFSLIVPRCDYE